MWRLAFLRQLFYSDSIVKTKTKSSKKQITAAGRVKRGMKLAIVPHENNGYRPHLIRFYGLVIMILAVFSLQLGYNGLKTGDVLGTEANITVTGLFNQTNVAREQNGVKPLNLNEKLNHAAFLKAKDMLSRQYWSHTSPDGVEPWKWFADAGYNYNEAGENLAKGFSTTSAIITAWLNSPEHKANIIKSNYRDVGFAVVSGKLSDRSTTIVVALYAEPAEKDIEGASVVSEALQDNNTNILAQFAIALQSITPAVTVGLVIISFSAIVSTMAHAYRHRLKKSIKQSWYRHHHGLLKTLGLIGLAVVMIFLYGGGQI